MKHYTSHNLVAYPRAAAFRGRRVLAPCYGFRLTKKEAPINGCASRYG